MNEKVSFAKKHPKWNLFIGVCLLLFLIGLTGGAIYLVIMILGNWISKIVEWFTTISSTIDAVVLVALITGAMSITGIIISSIIAKIVDYKHKRREYLTQKREKSYGEFVDMVYKIQLNGKNGYEYSQKEMQTDLSKFSKDITLWGSSKVIKKWVEFRGNGLNPNDAGKILFVLEEIMNEMRKDLGLKKVKKGDLLSFFINDIKKTMKRGNTK